MKPLEEIPVRVLVVEDDEAIRCTLTDILEFNGYAVLAAADGAEGLATARARLPDVIMADVAMPRLDGLAMLDALQADEQTRTIPVIVVSASAELDRMRAGMDRGAADYIIKPFTEEQVLRSIRARLEKKALLDELDAFAHTVAHDLKNPISALVARAALLRLGWAEEPEARKLDQLQELETGARRLAGIVDELLLLAGVRRMTVEPRPVDMGEAVREALARLGPEAAAAGVRIEQPAAWPVALGYAPWITEAWANYLSNGLKYGGRPPRLVLGADPSPAAGRLRFWVRDNGPGVPAELAPRLFQQFVRGTDTLATGHGLGLSIVRRIALKLGGAAGAENAPGGGARFWFELPAADGGALS